MCPTEIGNVKRVMRTFVNMWWGARRVRQPRKEVVEQLELDLPGSRLRRDEIRGLEALRRLRERLAAGEAGH